MVDEALKPLVPMLAKPKIRQIMENEPPDKAIQKIVERLHEAEKKRKKAREENAGAG
jgi:predicted Zn-dependent protease